MQAPPLAHAICFPLRNRPPYDCHVPTSRKQWHHRYFGAPRKDKNGNFRAHAGIDLIGPSETPIYAIDDGQIDAYSKHFFDITDALTVTHDNCLTVRYGEISRAAPGLMVKKGTPIKRGQLIAFIGKNSFGTSMLHIEFYAGSSRGSLSTPGNLFRRRSDLVNPTGDLDSAIVEPFHR